MLVEWERLEQKDVGSNHDQWIFLFGKGMCAYRVLKIGAGKHRAEIS